MLHVAPSTGRILLTKVYRSIGTLLRLMVARAIKHTVGIQSTRHTAAGWLLATSPLRNLPPPKKKRDPTYGDVSDVTNVIQEAVHFITQLITGDLRHGDLFAIGIEEARSNFLARKFLMIIAVLLKLKQNAPKERLNIWQSILITYIKLRSNVLFVWFFYMVFTWLNLQKLSEKLGPIAKLGCDTPTLYSTEKLWMLFLNQWWSCDHIRSCKCQQTVYSANVMLNPLVLLIRRVWGRE